MKLKIVGMDPSLRNWGLSHGSYDMGTGELVLTSVGIINTVSSVCKQVRKNSLDLEAAAQLCRGAHKAIQNADVVFVEVPVGSQSARAMASYGICVGIMGSLRALSTPFIEVTPAEVKRAAVGSVTATKQQMIDWAVGKHPEANWPTVTKKGVISICASKAEHMADATAAIYAGLACNSFQQMLPFLTLKAANS